MKSDIGMGYKLVVYEDNYHVRVKTEIIGFPDSSDAANYRDHSQYAGRPSEIQIDYNNYLDGAYSCADDMRSENTDDEKTKEPQRQSIKYYKDMARENFAEFRAAAILAVVGVGSFISFLLLIFSL